MRVVRTYDLLVTSHPVQPVADLVGFDLNNLTLGIVELVAGQKNRSAYESRPVSTGKKVKKKCQGKEQLCEVRTEREREQLIFPTRFLQYNSITEPGFKLASQLGVHTVTQEWCPCPSRGQYRNIRSDYLKASCSTGDVEKVGHSVYGDFQLVILYTQGQGRGRPGKKWRRKRRREMVKIK
jgi:hypothetical protein